MQGLFNVGSGLNVDDKFHLIFSTGAPANTARENAAPDSSLHINTTTGAIYSKKAPGTGTDKWVMIIGPDGEIVITSDQVKAALGFVPNNNYDIASFMMGLPVENEVVYRRRMGRLVTIPANFVGSIARSDVAATAQSVFTIKKNDTTVASITFALGATTGTFSVQGAITFIESDKFSIVAPSTVDSTLADIDFYILGSLTVI